MIAVQDDAEFNAYMAGVEAAEKAKDKSNNKDAAKGKFEFPECVGFADGKNCIVRFVNGAAPEEYLDKSDGEDGQARVVNIGWVKTDEGKPAHLTLPPQKSKAWKQNPFCQFIDKVLTKVYVDDPDNPGGDKIPKYVYCGRKDYGNGFAPEGGDPDGKFTLHGIWDNVRHSGRTPDEGKKYTQARSWEGQKVYIANVIDRTDYAWHQANKKTKLLMKNYNEWNGNMSHREASEYAISGPLAAIGKTHGNYAKYDMLIIPPDPSKSLDKCKLYNVSRYKEKDFWDEVAQYNVDANLVSIEKGYTQEESQWDVINIDKYYSLTPMGYILKAFGKTIKQFDDMTGTDFYGEISKQAELEPKYEKKTDDFTNTTTEEIAAEKAARVETPAPTVTPTPAAGKSAADEFYASL